ncbi:MAG TPA: hypothetical protein VGI16_05455 [Candidatus Acidoferrum sp.]
MDEAVMLQTSTQVQDYVLCSGCEQLLCNRGEDWILERLAVGVASPLYYALGGLEPILNEADFKTYSVVGNPEFDVEKITHFALGVFFKMAAHEWTIGKHKRRFQFGSYLGSIGSYLLGCGPFPAHCALMFCIHPPTDAPKRIALPYEWKTDGSRTYGFILIGLEFVLSLDKQMPPWHRDLCFVNGSSRFVIVANVTERLMNETTERIIRAGHVKGKLAKKLLP